MEISVEKVAFILFEKELAIQNLKEQIVALQNQLKAVDQKKSVIPEQVPIPDYS